MKLTKMSLVAALLVGSSAFAVDNIKLSGDAKLYYGTGDANDATLFNKDASAADVALTFNATADLAKNDLVTVSAGTSLTILTTLGLENNLVSSVWGGAHTATLGNGASYGAKVENAWWVPEAWVALSLNKGSKSTLKLGRMELDTPLAFTEKWSIEKNTFEAAVLINQDIPDTTVVAAWVGNGNGTETFGQDSRGAVNTLGLAAGAVVNADGQFTTYGTNGAYAIAVINNSFKPLTLQAWYYNVAKVADAYWLQADLKCQKIPGLMAGAQYEGVSYDRGLTVPDFPRTGTNTTLPADVDSSAMAFMIGYEMKDTVTVKAAYSSIDTDFNAGFNTATYYKSAQSKLYTEAWWNYGYITQADTDSFSVSVESPVNGIVDLGLYYTQADQSNDAGNNDLTEVTVTASKSFGPLDTTLAYIYTDAEDQNAGDAYNMIQAYLTLNF